MGNIGYFDGVFRGNLSRPPLLRLTKIVLWSHDQFKDLVSSPNRVNHNNNREKTMTTENSAQNNSAQKVLIVGAGVTGLAAAIELDQLGWDVTVIERAPERRRGGYFIALMPTGIAAAQRLGLGVLDKMPSRKPEGSHTFSINRTGTITPDMGYVGDTDTFRTLLRGDVENALYTSLPESVKVLFGTTVTAITQEPGSATATLRDASGERTETYDLILGADGVNSSIRKMVFGPDANYVHELGFMVAASLAPEPLTTVDNDNSYAYFEPGRSAWTFPFKGSKPSIMITYRAEDLETERKKDAAQALREEFSRNGAPSAHVEELLQYFEQAPDKLFDSAKQIRMNQFYNGRVVLIGDAAWCLTLYSGLGVSAGIAGANLLRNLLKDDSSIDEVLPVWNDRMRTYVRYQQKSAEQIGLNMFVPRNKLAYVLRKTAVTVLNTPLVKKLTAKKMSEMLFHEKGVDVADPAVALTYK